MGTLLAATLFASVRFAGGLAEPPVRVGFDVVDYVDNRRETPGSPTIFLDRSRIRYLFAAEANRARFVAAESRYEVQLGGRCGRMGPLSGSGRPEIHALYNGRLYFFASTQCRAGFLEGPERLLERDDTAPTPTVAQKSRGLELFAKFVDWAGGSKAVDSLEFVQQREEKTVESGGKKYRNVRIESLRLPGELRTEDWWDEAGYFSVLSRSGAFEASTKSGALRPPRPGEASPRKGSKPQDTGDLAGPRARRFCGGVAWNVPLGPQPGTRRSSLRRYLDRALHRRENGTARVPGVHGEGFGCRDRKSRAVVHVLRTRRRREDPLGLDRDLRRQARGEHGQACAQSLRRWNRRRVSQAWNIGDPRLPSRSLERSGGRACVLCGVRSKGGFWRRPPA